MTKCMSSMESYAEGCMDSTIGRFSELQGMLILSQDNKSMQATVKINLRRVDII